MSDAGLIRHIDVTPGVLLSSTVAETLPLYAAATDYPVGASVRYLDVIYESVQTPNVGHTPSTSPLYWAARGATERWKMFDDLTDTQTSATGALTTVLVPGPCNSLYAFGINAESLAVTVRRGEAGPVVYDKTLALDGAVITSLYEYIYEPFVQLSEIVLTDLPVYTDAHITVTFTGATVACGLLRPGSFFELGDTNYGVTVEVIDYSIKSFSATGTPKYTPGLFAKRISAEITVDPARFNKVARILESSRGPVAWIFSKVPGYEALNIFGWYRSAPLTAANVVQSRLNLEIEGMTQ